MASSVYTELMIISFYWSTNDGVSMHKSLQELHKDAICFEQILEAAPYKTATLWSLTAYLTNNQSKPSKAWWVLLEKKEQTHK